MKTHNLSRITFKIALFGLLLGLLGPVRVGYGAELPPSRAKQIKIEDAGTYYVGTQVEAALQEIGAGLAAYVPYTGATGNVNLGTHNITTTGTLTGSLLGSSMFATQANLVASDIAMWGDSITLGTGPLLSTTMPLYNVFNEGIGGQSSTQIKNREIAADSTIHSFITTIWAGHNNYSSPAIVKADIATMVAALGSNTHFLVLTVLNGNGMGIGTQAYTDIGTINSWIAATYPNNYYDIRAYLVSQYDPGIPQDVTDHTNDIIPSSLRVDTIHLTSAGYQLVANQISAFILAHWPASATDKPISYQSIPFIFKYPPPLGKIDMIDTGLGLSITASGHNLIYAMTSLSNYFGGDAGNQIMTGNSNTGFGQSALYTDTTGDSNSAFGWSTMNKNTIGHNNSAFGDNTLYSNTEGNYNAAFGESLYKNTTGSYNIGIGTSALGNTLTVNGSVAIGYASLFNAIGGYNTAIGWNAGRTITTGTINTFVGEEAGYNASQLVSATNSIAIGSGAYTTASNQVVIGNSSVTQTLLNGNVGIGTTVTTAYLHLKAGTASTSTSPFKFTLSGAVLNTTPEAGAFEPDSSGNLYMTDSSAARQTLAMIATTQTLTSKRITKRLVVVTQSATPAINTDVTDIASITGLAQAITSMTTSLTGTPVNGDVMMIQITDNGTARAITWGASFQSTTQATLPTTTVISTLLRTLLQWNSVASKWDCIAVD